MKRKNILLVMLVVFSGLLAMQSCVKDESPELAVKVAPVPSVPVPADGAVVPFTGAGQTLTLAWTGTSTETLKWTVYFDGDAVATDLSANTTTVTVATGGEYTWYVETTDVNKVKTTSPEWTVHVNSNPGVPVLTAPLNNATGVSKTAALTWTCTDPESDHVKYDIYFGTTATPGIVAGDVDALTYSPTMAYSTLYYWKVVAKDPYGGTSTSAVGQFTTGAFVPDFSVFKGIFSEVAPTFSATAKNDVFLQVNTTTHVITMYLPLAEGMKGAGWGTVYTGTHPITVTYDPVTFAITSTTQAWCDSYIDPTEMGPMTIKVSSGTIDAPNKKLTIKWTLDGNAYWGGAYTLGSTTYTFRANK